MIVGLPASRLDNVHVLATNRVLDLAAALSHLELGQDAVAWWNREDAADLVNQLRVGVATEDDNIADHDSSVWPAGLVAGLDECLGR